MRSWNYKYFRLLFLALLLYLGACAGVTEDDLQYLPGYWEIEKVTFPDGGDKRYTANTTVDYFELNGKRGYRKKMQPTLEGTFNTSADALPMEVKIRENRIFLVFSGGSEQWEEEVETLSADRLVTRHDNGLRYAYTRFEPINLATDGQK